MAVLPAWQVVYSAHTFTASCAPHTPSRVYTHLASLGLAHDWQGSMEAGAGDGRTWQPKARMIELMGRNWSSLRRPWSLGGGA
jgi:hypothetical protein